jgi:hypothetical protein
MREKKKRRGAPVDALAVRIHGRIEKGNQKEISPNNRKEKENIKGRASKKGTNIPLEQHEWGTNTEDA